jgi:outer membrane murein-binding lipoprotein Lpp
MQRRSVVIRMFSQIMAAACLVAGTLVSGCGSETGPTYEPEPGATKPAPAVTRLPAATKKLSKNVNANASNRGIKGKYAD